MSQDNDLKRSYSLLDDDGKIEYLRRFRTTLDIESAIFFLEIGTDKSQDDLIRTEVIKIIGLYTVIYSHSEIIEPLCNLILDGTEDDYVRVAAIGALSRLPITDDDIKCFIKILEGNDCMLVKRTAFFWMVRHKNLPAAHAALQKLVNDPEFGKSARRELSED